MKSLQLVTKMASKSIAPTCCPYHCFDSIGLGTYPTIFGSLTSYACFGFKAIVEGEFTPCIVHITY